MEDLENETLLPLKKLFATYVLYRHNCQVLHWKLHGPNFDTVHELMNDYIEHMHECVDSVAEILLMAGENPLCLEKCLDMVKEDDEFEYLYLDPKEDFTPEDVFAHINTMCNGILNIINSVYEIPGLPKAIASEMDGQGYWLMVEGRYKGRRRSF